MTIYDAAKWTGAVCSGLYDDREAAAITHLVMEKLTGMDRSARAIRKTDPLSSTQESTLNFYVGELERFRPVQYVLGEAWFAGLRFSVDERVLIPRPETEELVQWILNESFQEKITLLDIGTGSGCIPCSIGHRRKDIILRACDVSTEALELARTNAEALGISVGFFAGDILAADFVKVAGNPDVVVSNPPYIPGNTRLDRHVAGFEPSLALFVPGDDPLLFYKKIGNWVKHSLPANTPVFLELHHDHARETAAWFAAEGFATELRKDYSGNNRMLKAFR